MGLEERNLYKDELLSRSLTLELLMMLERMHHSLNLLPSDFAYGCVVLCLRPSNNPAHFFSPRHHTVCVSCAGVCASL